MYTGVQNLTPLNPKGNRGHSVSTWKGVETEKKLKKKKFDKLKNCSFKR